MTSRTTDTPSMARTLSDLSQLLSNQLNGVAQDIDEGSLTPWQLCGIAAQLDQAKGTIHRLRRDAGRLSGRDESEPPWGDEPVFGRIGWAAGLYP